MRGRRCGPRRTSGWGWIPPTTRWWTSATSSPDSAAITPTCRRCGASSTPTPKAVRSRYRSTSRRMRGERSVRDFTCPTCGQRLAFENSLCLACGSPLGFSFDDMALLVITDSDQSGHTGAVDADQYRLCANLHVAKCNWLVRSALGEELCASCVLTRTRPPDTDTAALASFAEAEQAKRRLIVELQELKLPIVGRAEDPHYGLAFDLLSSQSQPVVTGHQNGVITIDLAEGDDVHREQLRIAMDEPYRTLLGHFRHEIGHYYFYRLITPSADKMARFRELFGEPDTDYQAALDRHYAE